MPPFYAMLLQKIRQKLRQLVKENTSFRFQKLLYNYSEENVRTLTDQFNQLYYETEHQTWRTTHWMGVPLWKAPTDLWLYQEMFYELAPDVIVECGTANGGSAYYFASLFDLLGKGRIITIDIAETPYGMPLKDPDQRIRPEHPRITYLLGSSTSDEIVRKVKSLIQPHEQVMVILDSDHSYAHVLRELQAYAPLVQKGGYVVVEDSNVNGHPVFRSHGPGPMEALEAFLRENPDFESDRSREKYYLTFNPKGYLRRR